MIISKRRPSVGLEVVAIGRGAGVGFAFELRDLSSS